MNFLSYAHFTAFLIYVWLIFFIVSKNPKAKLNRVTALVFVSFAFWNLTTTFYYAAATKESALHWLNITSFGWCNLISLFLWFTLVFTNHEKILRKWYFYIINFTFPAIFIYRQFTGDLACDLSKQYYGWSSVWSGSIWPWLLYAHYFVTLSVALYLSFVFIQKAKLVHEKKRAKLVIITGVIPLVLSTVTDIILVYLKAPVIPPLGAIFILIWAGGIVFAITKYKLMVLTPAYAAADILATMSDSLILIDPAGKIIEVNKAASDLLGFSRAEITGQPVAILFSQRTPITKQFDWVRFFQKGAFQEQQIAFRNNNGNSIPVSISSAIMRDQDENLIGVVVIARDLRELLRLQEREREFTMEKARAEALQERAHELQEAYDQLKAVQARLIQSEKMAAVGQLAGGVAHEVNNPIGIILGFAQSIVRRIKDDDLLYLPLKSIEREAVRCKKLVGDLLTFSRSGKTRAEIIEVNTIIDETISLIEAQAKVKSIVIIKEYGTGLPQITANKNQLQQVIMNLCNNAIAAMPDGGKLTIITKHTDNQIEIWISDTGHGIPEAVKQHIFDPFFTTKEVGQGTGLGLSLCYEILKKHHGIIEVESEAGKGATFKVKLPIPDLKN